jgi:hypothetical protein
MKKIAIFLGIVIAAILVLTLGSGLLVAIAYGIGWLVNLVTGFGTLPATALGLAGMFVFVFLVERVVRIIMSTPSYKSYADFDDEFDDEYDDDEFDDEYDEFDDFDDVVPDKLSPAEQEELDKIYAGIPRWRRPTKNPDFSSAKLDDRCPCGSGKKYKNCHGKNKK